MMSRPSNSGIATWVAASSGVSPSSLPAHCVAGRGQAQPLQDRHVQARPARRRPSPRRRRRPRPPPGEAAGGEHGHDDRVGGAQRVDQLGLGGPQRRAEQRQRPPARRLDRIGAARARSRCSPRGDGRGSTAWRPPAGVRSRPRAPGPRDRSSSPQVGHRARGVRTRRRSAAPRRTGTGRAAAGSPARRAPGRRAPRRRSRPGTVDSSISSASGACSPPSTMAGTPEASTRVQPVLPGPAPAEDAHDNDVRAVEQAGTSLADRRAGLPSRYPAPLARADSRSVSEVDSKAITAR